MSKIIISKPPLRWLFGGFGFHNSEATMTALMSEKVKNEIVLNIGDKETISYECLPDGVSDDVTWHSSDYNIVTVSDGIVTAVNKGTAIITITSCKKDENNEEKNYTKTTERFIKRIEKVAGKEINRNVIISIIEKIFIYKNKNDLKIKIQVYDIPELFEDYTHDK